MALIWATQAVRLHDSYKAQAVVVQTKIDTFCTSTILSLTQLLAFTQSQTFLTFYFYKVALPLGAGVLAPEPLQVHHANVAPPVFRAESCVDLQKRVRHLSVLALVAADWSFKVLGANRGVVNSERIPISRVDRLRHHGRIDGKGTPWGNLGHQEGQNHIILQKGRGGAGGPLQSEIDYLSSTMSTFILENPDNFKHILRILNTNIEGKRTVPYALRAIKGCGRRFAYLICKILKVNPSIRAGELNDGHCDKIAEIIANPEKFNVPVWFLNRQKDYKDGKNYQVASNVLDTKLREDIERYKKIKSNKGIRHHFGLRIRGQHTKTTGRRGATIGVERKKK